MIIEEFSRTYSVRQLRHSDAQTVYALYSGNSQYFSAMQDCPTIESAKDDLTALPPGKTVDDKFYLGFYRDETLVAIMDLILRYPDEQTAFIGLFMVSRDMQGKGTGTSIVTQALEYLKVLGFSSCRLGYVKTNQQSKSFWHKNGFLPTGLESQREKYDIVIMEKGLKK